MADEKPVPDGPEMRKDGTVLVVIDGQRWSLKRPKMGEFRKLRERLHEVQDEAFTKAAESQEAATEVEGESLTERTLRVRKTTRELNAHSEELYAQWVREVFEALCTKALPAEDDWPTWLATGEFINDLVTHWRTVPLRSGAG